MKVLLAFLLTLIVLPAFADPFSDRTGLKTSYSIQVGKETYVVESTANFDVRNVSFENDTLVIAVNSSLENNIGEIQIPHGITQGALRFSLDGAEITPKIMQNERISFVTLEFIGNGTHTIKVTSDFTPKTTDEVYPTNTTVDERPDNLLIILGAVGIVVAGGIASTLAVYLKRKKA